MNIPLHLLDTLVAFSLEKTVLATAQRLGTTQPTVTRQLQQLEALLEHPLFENVGRQKRLTPYGELLSQKLSARFENIQNIIQEATLEEGHTKNLDLRIGGRAEILKRVFGLKKFPLRVVLEPMGSQEIKKAMQSAQVDIAILQDNFSSFSYVKKVLFSDDWHLVVPERYLEKHQNIEKWKIQSGDFPYASYKKDMQLLIMGLAHIDVVPARDAFVFPDWTTIEERVHRGLNWSVIPSSYIVPKRNYRTLKMSHLPAQIFYAYYKKSLNRREELQEILSQILAH